MLDCFILEIIAYILVHQIKNLFQKILWAKWLFFFFEVMFPCGLTLHLQQ